MTIRTTISILALSAAMSFSGSAYAQTMIDGVEVPADQLSAVQEKCTALSTESIASTPADDGAEEADDAEDGDDQEGEDDGAMSTTTGIDIETLTVEQCREAGLID